MPKKFQSLSRVLKLRLVTLLTVGIALLSGAIGFRQYQKLETGLKNRAKTTLIVTSKSMSDPLWNINQESIKEFSDAVLNDKEVVYYEVLDNSQNSVYTAQAEGSSGKYEEICTLSSRLCSEESVLRENETIGKVRIAFTLEHIRSEVLETVLLLCSLGLLVIVVLTFFISYIIRNLVKEPLETLNDGAKHLAAGELNFDFNIESNNEIGELAKSFRTMRDAIRDRIHDLSQLNEVGETISSQRQPAELMKLLADVGIEKLKAKNGASYLFHDKKGFIRSSQTAEEYPETLKLTEEEFKKHFTKASASLSHGKVLDFSADSLVVMPQMGQNGDLFGAFVAQIESKDALSESASTFLETMNRTAGIRLANIRMMDLIEEHNRNLEKIVAERTRDLARKTNDLNSMLSNVKLGIFTLMPEKTVHPEYSKYLEDIYENKDLANKSAMSVIFMNSNVGSDVRDQVENAIDMMIGEYSWNFDANESLFIKELSIKGQDQKSKDIELEWNPILNEDGIIERLLVTARDVTEIKQLRAKAAEKAAEMEMVYQILSVGKEKFERFANFTLRTIEESRTLIKNTPKKDSDVVDKMFRLLHTLKGAARTLGFLRLTNGVHEAENRYSQFRLKESAEWVPLQLLSDIEKIAVDFASYQTIYNKSILQFINAEQNKHNDHAHLDSIITEIKIGLADVATKLHKPFPAIRLHGESKHTLDHSIAFDLKLALVHIMTNCLDHGIEAPEIRTMRGKDREGHINIECSAQNNRYAIKIWDDGAGLDLDLLRSKLIARGIDVSQWTELEVARSIFLPNLSTAENVTEISGRGVGLDAVRETIEDLGGAVDLVLRPEARIGKNALIAFVIDIPLKAMAKSA